MISGAGSFFDPRSLAIDNEYIPPDENFYFTDKVTDYAIEFIDQNKKIYAAADPRGDDYASGE